jgi:hypothetical protein
MATIRRTFTKGDRDAYLRALGLKKVMRDDGRVQWVKDKSIKEPKLQFGAGIQFK